MSIHSHFPQIQIYLQRPLVEVCDDIVLQLEPLEVPEKMKGGVGHGADAVVGDVQVLQVGQRPQGVVRQVVHGVRQSVGDLEADQAVAQLELDKS